MARVARQLLDLHDHLGALGMSSLTWFVVDVRGVWGRTCGGMLVGHEIVERTVRNSAQARQVPAMPFPIEGSDALVLVQLLEPRLIDLIQQRPAGETAVVVTDHEDDVALVWLSEVDDLRPSRA